MRAIFLFAGLVACSGGKESEDVADSDTGTPADADADTDTDSDSDTDSDTDTDSDADADTDTGACEAQVDGLVGPGPAIDCTYAADCQGTLYIGVYDVDPETNPTAVPIAGNFAKNVDISTTPFPFVVRNVPCGTNWIVAFLDVNLNVKGNPRPDTGDLVSPAVQGTITSSGATLPLPLTTRYP